jgi:hypothetical protein
MSTEITTLSTPDNYDAAVEQIAGTLMNIKAHALVGYWHIGRDINHMENDGKKYGQKIIQRVSDSLREQGQQCGVRILQEAHKFYKANPSEKALKNAIATGLSWSHMRHVSRIEDAEKRKEFVGVVVENEWSARDAEREVKKVLGKNPTEKNANKLKKEAGKQAKEENSETAANETDTAEAPTIEQVDDKALELPKDTISPIKGYELVSTMMGQLDLHLKGATILSKVIAEHPQKLKDWETVAKDMDLTSDEDYEKIVALAMTISEKASAFLEQYEEYKQTMEGIAGVIKTHHANLKDASWYSE